ncbi:hypothetical protein AGABI2DRAFT_207333 [Agaricus bisporus var. bisporus H97]|uniref:hypothetical protein n=1 Tax=Agaricus bisporus var. bisporus (strain H97 / ATCC MYA-4626 / FGSC 10389) TaxID=936046 RepID=UPI00029F61DB|nr:hypothetical protein AGABI2DRAFT_207333 [Agaricus bisporus var. bisporus H97]EKV45921.1 hypothetical protein AGABI2DRAFT_207333 [Agaricus bisporus var. bisporus H97]
MDDLAHTLRKRKSRQDDHDGNKSESGRQNCDKDLTGRPAKAPRLSLLSSDTTPALWNTPSSPQVATPITSPSTFSPVFPLKSSRLNGRHLSALEQPSSPSSPTSPAHSDNATYCDSEDVNILLGTGQLPHLPLGSDEALLMQAATLDIAALQLPPLVPSINRQALKDLDFNEIMHNTPLRHDILFDSALQFRPAGHRRKKENVERYWDAVAREIESGCTCVSYDTSSRRYIPTICVCDRVPLPTDAPLTFTIPPSYITVRTPSRVRALLNEFLEVLLHVIQPLATLSGPYVKTEVLQGPVEEHAEQAKHIRSLFDLDLIEQELKHGVFDPSGLFQVIGLTLKNHCAPMRDHAVDSMVEAAKACAPGGSATIRDAVKVVRNCSEILELMKLDIANHQMQTLRPFLVYSSGAFERKMLRSRRSIDPSLPLTKEWLRFAHTTFSSQEEPIKYPSQPQGLRYTSLGKKHQLYISVVRSIVDMVFDPPSSSSPSLVTTTLPSPPSDLPFPSFPETLYLDQARIQTYTSEIADLVALWMFLLLYRQLISSFGHRKHQKERINEFASILKREIRAIGPRSLGTCFLECSNSSGSNQNPTTDKLKSALGEVLLPSKDCLGIALPKSAIPFSDNKVPAQEDGMGNGLEMLSDEVQSLVEKISLLVVVHFNAYLPVYEKEEFMQSVL